jgi:putative redox protein
MNAKVRWTGGLSFEATGDSGHAVRMDASKEFKGSDSGSRPTELLLMALGGCTGMDVVSILEKKRLAIDDFWVEVSAGKTDTHPKMLKEFKVKFVLVGKNIPRKDVERAVELSADKYCTVGAMMKASTTVTHEVEIRESA